ncbi:hypothetical protein [Clostridium formicaceticum]|uniref:Vitamin B12 dependent methionine synthase n=1 Tax=Clostridium formicaceticum TaxID=1497 RepID=A0AAC9WIB4_9CLOT|nr:hypothetical protein [Clostridium formicaceticum]AOY77981.1 hypothetical protein BJL90_20195 [Clostridium formicaceticum]ARE88605.1 hypothetical protein CLFO_30110 [Clostridium formicaceticum]
MMQMIKDFQWKIDRAKIFDRINCQPDDTLYQQYEALLRELKVLADPIGVYKYQKRCFEGPYQLVNNCSHIVYCFVSIDNKVSDRIQYYFEIGNYFKGILLDSMADQMLFSISDEVANSVFIEAEKRFLGLTGKIEPGQKEIPLELQEEILAKLNEGERRPIAARVTEGFMLDPLKSMTFMYGADKSLPLVPKVHDCKECSSMNCQFRQKL